MGVLEFRFATRNHPPYVTGVTRQHRDTPADESPRAASPPDVWYARVCAVIGIGVGFSLPMVQVRLGFEDRPLLEAPWLLLMYCAGLVNVLFWFLRSFRFGSHQFVLLGWSISLGWHAIPVALGIALPPLAAASIGLFPLFVLSVLICLCLSMLALRGLQAHYHQQVCSHSPRPRRGPLPGSASKSGRRSRAASSRDMR